MDFDLKGARAAGYTDAQIADAMAAKANFDIAGARGAKYSDQQIIELLSKPRAAADMVPGGGVAGNRNVGKPDGQTLADKVIGTGEAALTLATGATGGALGTVGGTAKGLVDAVRSGNFGTQAGVRQVEQAAAEGAEALTYQPRTESGQEQAAAAGDALSAVLPATALTAEMGAGGQAARAATGAAQDLTAGTVARAAGAAKNVAIGAVDRIRQASPDIAARIERTLGRNPEPTPTPGTRGSVGAAGTDMATQRRQVADQVGVDLTLGQATRDQNQLRFEQETAKGEQGALLRERYSDQNEQILKHFDNLVDQTGKATPDLAGTGRSVDGGLLAGYDHDNGRVKAAYVQAKKSPEGDLQLDPGERVRLPYGDEELVASPISYLNEKPSGLKTTGLTDHARDYAVRLGIAEKQKDGTLIAKPATVRQMEEWRKEIGQATGFEPVEVRDSAILKGLIDAQTEPLAGPLFRQARRLRENLAKKYEDRGVVASLLNTKKGMADRQVAIADVFQHSILDASREDVGAVRRALTGHGKDAPAEVVELGRQAWRDLQGETLNWIKDQAFANTATDQRGNVILSVPKLHNAIKRLDADGRLQTIFGTQGAQHLRDLNDLAKHVYTTPPGTVNTSNTASVLLAALGEAGVTGSMTGLPVPVLSTLRVLSKQVKNRQLQKRIEVALTRGRAAANNNQSPARPAGATLH